MWNTAFALKKKQTKKKKKKSEKHKIQRKMCHVIFRLANVNMEIWQVP